MNNVLLRIKEMRLALAPCEELVADYILNNVKDACDTNIRVLSAMTNTSPSSIVRLCRKLDFDGFQDFSKSLLYNAVAIVQDRLVLKENTITKEDDVKSIVKTISTYNRETLEETQSLIDVDTISYCAELLISAHKILLFGLSFSYLSAKDLYLKLLRLDLPVVCNEDYHAQMISANNYTDKDSAIIFSYSGKTKEMLKLLKILKNNTTTVIAITRFSPSMISKLAYYNLYVATINPLFDKEAVASRVATLNIIDIMYTIYIIRNYNDSINKLLNTCIEKER
ncbi:MAG: MurR/RpiR family transcriptional regulator [Solobacterium sp.]|nr:MurR/RpiR family transcriptional regulator [Solobacterium sp.]